MQGHIRGVIYSYLVLLNWTKRTRLLHSLRLSTCHIQVGLDLSSTFSFFHPNCFECGLKSSIKSTYCAEYSTSTSEAQWKFKHDCSVCSITFTSTFFSF